MLTRGALGQDVLDSLYTFALETYDSLPQVKDQIFEVMTMDGAYEKGSDFVLMSNVQEVEDGDPATQSQIIPGYSWMIKARTLQSVIEIGYDAVADGKLNLNEIGNQLGQHFVAAEETMAARIFNYGAWAAGDAIFDNSIYGAGAVVDASGLFIYDGQPFFSTAHPNKRGVNTYDNYDATALSRDAAGVTNLENALNKMEFTNAYDNADQRIDIKADTILVPRSLTRAADEIINSLTGRPYVATNEKNVNSGALNIISWAYLTAAAGWFIGSAKNGIRWYNRSPLQIDQDKDDHRRVYKVILSKRVGIGVTNWRYWLANNIASA